MCTVVVLVMLTIQLFGPPAAFAPPADSYDRATLTLVDESGQPLAMVDVRIADTTYTKFVGLSTTTSLEDGEGMLFVHDAEAEHTYSMRGMDYPIDIVFINADGTVTEIHHADPPDGFSRPDTVTGHGRYVLELPAGWTTRTGIEPGNRIELPDID